MDDTAFKDTIAKFREVEDWFFNGYAESSTQYLKSMLEVSFLPAIEKAILVGIFWRDRYSFLSTLLKSTFTSQTPVGVIMAMCILLACFLPGIFAVIIVFRKKQKQGHRATQCVTGRKSLWVTFIVFLVCSLCALLSSILLGIAAARGYYTLVVPFKFAEQSVQSAFQLSGLLHPLFENYIREMSHNTFESSLALYRVDEEVGSEYLDRVHRVFYPVFEIASTLNYQMTQALEKLAHHHDNLPQLVNRTTVGLGRLSRRYRDALRNIKETFDYEELHTIVPLPDFQVSSESVQTLEGPIALMRNVSKINLQLGFREMNNQLEDVAYQEYFDPTDLVSEVRHFAFEVENKLNVIVERYLTFVEKGFRSDKDSVTGQIQSLEASAMEGALPIFVFLVVIGLVCIVFVCAALGVYVIAFVASLREPLQRTSIEGLSTRTPIEQGSTTRIPIEGPPTGNPIEQGPPTGTPIEQGSTTRIPIEQGSTTRTPIEQGPCTKTPIEPAQKLLSKYQVLCGRILFHFSFFTTCLLIVMWALSLFLFLLSVVAMGACVSVADKSIFDVTFDDQVFHEKPYWFDMFTSKEFNMTVKDTVTRCLAGTAYVPFIPDDIPAKSDVTDLVAGVNYSSVADSVGNRIRNLTGYNASFFTVPSNLSSLLDEVDVEPIFEEFRSLQEKVTELQAEKALKRLRKKIKDAEVLKEVDVAEKAYQDVLSNLNAVIASQKEFNDSLMTVRYLLMTYEKGLDDMVKTSSSLVSTVIYSSPYIYETTLQNTVAKRVEQILFEMRLTIRNFRKEIAFCKYLLIFYDVMRSIFCNVLLYPVVTAWKMTLVMCFFLLGLIVASVLPLHVFLREVGLDEVEEDEAEEVSGEEADENGKEAAEKVEKEAEKSEDEVEKSEDEADKGEEQADNSDEEAEKSDIEAEKSEDEAENEGKAEKSEDEVEENKQETLHGCFCFGNKRS